jgi:hypothetical protein
VATNNLICELKDSSLENLNIFLKEIEENDSDDGYLV